MIVYYACSTNCGFDSFEEKLAAELQKADFEMWSTDITLEADTENISDNNDDNFGNTNAAILVINEEYLADKEKLSTVLKNISEYKTIELFFVFHNVGMGEATKALGKIMPELKEKLNKKHIFNTRDNDVKILSSKICKSLFSINDRCTDRIKTEIETLDYLLGGGLIRGSSLNIIGPSGSGTTTLGIHIQKNILEQDRSCLYITYGLSPIKILRRFEEMGCDITKYIQNGKFRIFDSFSALNNLTLDDTRQSVGDEWFPAIVRVDNPMDVKAYFEQQIETIRNMGAGGVNIIDATNERYDISRQQREGSGEETYKKHFSRFKAMAGDTLQNVGIHLVRADSELNEELIKHLTRTEDGDICLISRSDKFGGINRFLKIKGNGQYGRGDTKEYGYKIGKTGFKFLGSLNGE